MNDDTIEILSELRSRRGESSRDQDRTGRGRETPLWLDCDPGHDDAFAILVAACHPRLTLLGVSSVHGNASLSHTTANAASMLTAVGAWHVPCYAGAAKPFCREAVHAPDIHGDSGIDGTDLLPKADIQPITKTSTVLAMWEALMAQPAGTAWLVATGALTNVALLFSTFPEVADHIQGLSIMGGAIGDGFTDATLGHVEGKGERFGNETRWAEFNIYCDPEAAQSIFSNAGLACKTTLIPLDLTHKVLATTAVQERLLHGPASGPEREDLVIRQLFRDLLVFFARTYRDVFGIAEGPPLHDPVAVAVVLFDIGAEKLAFDDLDGERWRVKVVTDGIHSSLEEERGQVGRTVIWRADGKGVRIPRSLDVANFWKVVGGCLERAEESLSKRPVSSGFRGH